MKHQAEACASDLGDGSHVTCLIMLFFYSSQRQCNINVELYIIVWGAVYLMNVLITFSYIQDFHNHTTQPL